MKIPGLDELITGFETRGDTMQGSLDDLVTLLRLIEEHTYRTAPWDYQNRVADARAVTLSTLDFDEVQT